ncbi:hypothetical protein G7Z17_g578 [Cylindrodendrum hubeiense]|uniref:Uncharacterized protein n=1 Tax=Cylindrodendrum hubeiense TaxID=595255 RepID=A0A9P5HK07_9HYPO|nr:hypothetical protein G7Z17_g578 [Cylindrodendrum hubeiense]
MEPEISQSPADASIGQQWQPLSPRSPGQSTEAASNLNSPWFDPLSPYLQDSSVFDPKHGSHMGLMGVDRVDTTPGLGVLQSGRRLSVYHSSTEELHQSDPWWKKVLKSKWSMIIGLMLGVAGAVSHHILYDHLHGREAKDQRWWLRLGQLISFIAKANFVVTVMMAHQQVAWREVGQKGFTLGAIDSLFGSTHNFMELFNREAWIKSRLIMLLAIYVWASPFVVIFTSATLDVITGTIQENATCPSVRTLNFFNEGKRSWHYDKKADNNILNGLSISAYNETVKGGNMKLSLYSDTVEGKNTIRLNNTNDSNIFEYWDQPSKALSSIASVVLSSGRAIQRENVSVEICGKGWDCSTTVHFIAPGYNCSLGKAEAPFNLSSLGPTGNYTYQAVTDRGEYARPQIRLQDDKAGSLPLKGPPFPKDLGAFRTEPIIWIGYREVDDTPRNYTPVIFSCEHWETNYTVDFNYTGGLQTYNVTNRDYMRKIIKSRYTGNNTDNSTLDRTTADPKSSYVFPKPDYLRYRRVAAYHSLGKKLRDLLAGSIKSDNVAEGDVVTSKLIDRRNGLPVPRLDEAVRRLYEDLIISLLSDPQLLVVSWAANSSRLSGIGVGDEDTRYNCVRQQKTALFFYHWQALAAVYIASFAIAAVAVAYGILAMNQEGINKQRDMTFSSIAGATRRVNMDDDEDGVTKMRAWPIEEGPGGRLYEFRAEGRGG